LAFGAHEGRPFLVFDLPEGETLQDLLGKAELTVTRAVLLGLQLCEGLEHLHRHGLVHRALLPGNVWVTQSPAADLLKLGPPRIGPATDISAPTRDRLYRPPERSGASDDYRADLYAAGMLLYVMCTGRDPSAEAVAEIAAGAPVPPPRAVSPERGISDRLERVILRAVAPSPDVRFGTAGELMAALQSAGARSTTPKRRPAKRPRKRAAMIGSIFATLAVLGATALRSNGGQRSSASPAAQAAQRPIIAANVTIDQRGTQATPPVEPNQKAAPGAVPARTEQVVATRSRAPSDDERSEIWSLLDGGRLDEGAARIKPLLSDDPEAAWPRLALGVLYYRKYWRHDAVKEWQLALAQDRDIRRDPQFEAYFCFMLDETWKAAGVTDLLNQLGAEAVPLLDHCVASAKTPRLRALASRTLDHLRQAERRSRR
jgi:hypothetical protein